MPLNPGDDIKILSGVGDKNAKKLAKLGIFSIQDLIFHFPYRYDDFSVVEKIQNLQVGRTYTIKAKIVKKNSRPSFRRRVNVLEILVADASGSIQITWFNQSYLWDILQEGRTYFFSGQASFYKVLQIQNPVWELAKKEMLHTARIVPVYPLTFGIHLKWLRTLLKNVLDNSTKFQEYLPETILKSNSLINIDLALRSIHFPKNMEEVKKAQNRLAFDELLFYQIRILLNKTRLAGSRAHPLAFQKELTKKFVESLPFILTTSQKSAAWQILQDLQKERPANRLLSGDVGSGKTIVAAIAVLQCLAAKMLAAVLAPTEILASQHFNSFCKLPIINRHTIALMTSSKTAILQDGQVQIVKKSQLLKKVEEKNITLIIGTQSLIQQNVNLNRLGLIVVDEQHRFGVEQRAYLQNSAKNDYLPHFLSMTATPIPRTLALTLYGDLNISKIEQLPAGRKKIITELISTSQRSVANARIEQEINAGRQIFVICPLIDPSDKLGIKSATEEYHRLKTQIFPKRQIGILHGKLKTAEKDNVIKDFRDKKLDILVSTTVVEVGVDFPNATIMVIEGAERFGLAQLHQLRGRVGRGEHQSYCFLVSNTLGDKSRQRLQAMIKYSNGLELAEIDLKLRGPGEVYGSLQSGYPGFKIANVFDVVALESARQSAETILKENPKSALLTKKIEDIKNSTHLE